MSDKKPSGGIVLYPLVYNLDTDDQDKSNIICRGIDNKIYQFFLNPPASAREKAARDKSFSIPKIAKFAESHKKAVNPCMASLDNGRDKPNGIFIGEQITQKGTAEVDLGGVAVQAQVIEGSWASVIRDAHDGFRAPIGYGYLETNFHSKLSPQGNEYLLRYKEIKEILLNPDSAPGADLIDLTSEKATLAGLINAERRKWFVGVLVHCQRTETLQPENISQLRDSVQKYLVGLTKTGLYGGVIIRPHKNNVVHTALCKTYEHKYNYTEKKVEDINVVMDDFMKFYGNKLIREAQSKQLLVDIIPVERFNCGGPGNDRYSNDVNSASSKIMKTFVDKDLHDDPEANIKGKCGFLYAKVAMRLATTVDGTQNLLLSALHAFSRPMGSILSIGRNGEPTFKLDSNKSESPSPVM